MAPTHSLTISGNADLNAAGHNGGMMAQTALSPILWQTPRIVCSRRRRRRHREAVMAYTAECVIAASARLSQPQLHSLYLVAGRRDGGLLRDGRSGGADSTPLIAGAALGARSGARHRDLSGLARSCLGHRCEQNCGSSTRGAPGVGQGATIPRVAGGADRGARRLFDMDDPSPTPTWEQVAPPARMCCSWHGHPRQERLDRPHIAGRARVPSRRRLRLRSRRRATRPLDRRSAWNGLPVRHRAEAAVHPHSSSLEPDRPGAGRPGAPAWRRGGSDQSRRKRP